MSHPSGEGSQLAELLACERELAVGLARARQEAEALVESARVEASRAGAELEAALEAEVDQVRSGIREDTELGVREIYAQGRERVRAFEEVSDGELERLAGAAFRDLIGAARPQ